MEKYNIYDFTDYKVFLKEYFDEKKRQNAHWSYQSWSSKLGLKNNSSLIKIIRNQREAGPKITQRLCDYFEFNDKERAYFENLIRLSKAEKDPQLKTYILESLRRLHPQRKFKVLDDQKFAAISHWWFYVLRKMTFFKSFKRDSEWLSNSLRFPLSPKEIDVALETLFKLNLLEIDPETQKIKQTRELLDTTDDISNEAIRQYHRENLQLAVEALDKVNVAEREISGVTLSFSSKKLREVKEFIRNFQYQFEELFQSEEPDSVYQLNMQFFPVTNRIEGEGDK